MFLSNVWQSAVRNDNEQTASFELRNTRKAPSININVCVFLFLVVLGKYSS